MVTCYFCAKKLTPKREPPILVKWGVRIVEACRKCVEEGKFRLANPQRETWYRDGNRWILEKIYGKWCIARAAYNGDIIPKERLSWREFSTKAEAVKYLKEKWSAKPFGYKFNPLHYFRCSVCGTSAPESLLPHSKFTERMSWLRRHYKSKHPVEFRRMYERNPLFETLGIGALTGLGVGSGFVVASKAINKVWKNPVTIDGRDFPIVDIGQLSPDIRKELASLVSKGKIIKYADYTFPGTKAGYILASHRISPEKQAKKESLRSLREGSWRWHPHFKQIEQKMVEELRRNPMLRDKKRSELSKSIWRRRKREGGKGVCWHCKRNVYTGGARKDGHLFHKVCWATYQAGRKR